LDVGLGVSLGGIEKNPGRRRCTSRQKRGEIATWTARQLKGCTFRILGIDPEPSRGRDIQEKSSVPSLALVWYQKFKKWVKKTGSAGDSSY